MSTNNQALSNSEGEEEPKAYQIVRRAALVEARQAQMKNDFLARVDEILQAFEEAILKCPAHCRYLDVAATLGRSYYPPRWRPISDETDVWTRVDSELSAAGYQLLYNCNKVPIGVRW